MTSATDYEIAELASRFGLSHTTTRSILDTLESEGWAPPGTYVRNEGGKFYNQDDDPTFEVVGGNATSEGTEIVRRRKPKNTCGSCGVEILSEGLCGGCIAEGQHMEDISDLRDAPIPEDDFLRPPL